MFIIENNLFQFCFGNIYIKWLEKELMCHRSGTKIYDIYWIYVIYMNITNNTEFLSNGYIHVFKAKYLLINI